MHAKQHLLTLQRCAQSWCSPLLSTPQLKMPRTWAARTPADWKPRAGARLATARPAGRVQRCAELGQLSGPQYPADSLTSPPKHGTRSFAHQIPQCDEAPPPGTADEEQPVQNLNFVSLFFTTN